MLKLLSNVAALPYGADPIVDRSLAHAVKSGDFGCLQKLAVNDGCFGVAPIVLLNPPGCPANIARLVMAIRVYAVKCVGLARSASNILEKLFIGTLPCFAYADPTPAVIGVVGVGGTAASLPHRVPNRVLSGPRARFAAGLTVRLVGGGANRPRPIEFKQQATAATNARQGPKQAALNDLFAAAVTLTAPKRNSFGTMPSDHFNGNQPAAALSRDVFEVCHGGLYIINMLQTP